MRFVGVDGKLLVGSASKGFWVMFCLLQCSFSYYHYTFLFAIFNSCVNVITCFVGEQALQTM